MSSSKTGPRLFMIHVVTPAGDRVELDCEPCADFPVAANRALAVALKLANPGGGILGPPREVADVLERLEDLGDLAGGRIDPRECLVRVVRASAAGRAAPNGWWVAKTERVAAYADMVPPAACVGTRA